MNYLTRIVSSLSEIGSSSWDALANAQSEANPFLSYAFLQALHASGCASEATGWRPLYLTLWQHTQLEAALPLYVKTHSYGEYVFDWAWAEAYQRNGLTYYPKLLSAIPFTPVSGSRLLARSPEARAALVDALCALQEQNGISSVHVLFPPTAQAELLQQAGFLLRSGVQFHWMNEGYRNFDEFLSTLERKKRKNIRAERRKVQDAGIRFRQVPGEHVTPQDWDLFHDCYTHTYMAHHSTPYLSLEFFRQIGATMPQHILLIVAELDGRPIAASLCIHDGQTLYGRYWGALREIPCLHFETAYYQPLEFCIEHDIQRFEGGAQGEHKLARGFLPHQTWSAHRLIHPGFSAAIQRFLEQESEGIHAYMDELNEHNPFRRA